MVQIDNKILKNILLLLIFLLFLATIVLGAYLFLFNTSEEKVLAQTNEQSKNSVGNSAAISNQILDTNEKKKPLFFKESAKSSTSWLKVIFFGLLFILFIIFRKDISKKFQELLDKSR